MGDKSVRREKQEMERREREEERRGGGIKRANELIEKVTSALKLAISSQ